MITHTQRGGTGEREEKGGGWNGEQRRCRVKGVKGVEAQGKGEPKEWQGLMMFKLLGISHTRRAP